jgi:hypothetical protein
MRRLINFLLPFLGLGAMACDSYRGPKLALPTGQEQSGTTEHRQVGSRNGATLYGGKTAAQWSESLKTNDRDQVSETCRVLHVLGSEGRPYLWQGLDNANPETRRCCLEHLSIADFKREGEGGRQKLVQLSGDPADIRIRERATALLQQWHGSIPSP